MDAPRVLIAGLGGDSGKTLISVGLAAAWRKQGLVVAPFKKGPDFIDAAWLSRAADTPCGNLDLFLMSPGAIKGAFAERAAESDVAVIEGNRGLFDGGDAQGTCSTAELAKLLGTPVVLVVDGTKRTRTVAAMVLGCQALDPDLHMAGVVLNRSGGPRHVTVMREAVEEICGLPVVGALPRMKGQPFPERHLGLVPPEEHARMGESVRMARRTVAEHLDLDAIRRLAREAPALDASFEPPSPEARDEGAPVRVGVLRDAAFQFYYNENLEALRRAGAELVEISPLTDTALPPVDAVYAGGGFPESFAATLAENRPFRESLRRAVENDLPVYAECGGAVYLGRELHLDGRTYPMAGAIPAVFGFQEKPQGHGYVEMKAVKPNPFYEVGEAVRGHEFHYTFPRAVIAENVTFAFRVQRGTGFGTDRDGLCHRNVLACYTHVHALGVPGWAPALVDAARRHKDASSAAPAPAGEGL